MKINPNMMNYKNGVRRIPHGISSYAEIAKEIPSTAKKYPGIEPSAPNEGYGYNSLYGNTNVPIPNATSSPAPTYSAQLGNGMQKAPPASSNGTNKPIAPAPPMSYEEFFAKQNAFNEEIKNAQLSYYEKLKKDAYAAAEAQKNQANKDAEILNEREVVDARNAYAENLATRGANAEKLAEMGLSSSGYSDFVNAGAYATERSEIAGANAKADNAKRNAGYQEFLMKNAADREANQGKLNAEIGYKQNLMQSEANKFAYEQAEKESKDALYLNLYENLRVGMPYIDSDIIRAYQRGEIDESQYNELKKLYNEVMKFDKKTAFFAQDLDGDIATLPVADAKKRLQEVLDNPLLSQDSKDKWQDHYNDMYAPTIKGKASLEWYQDKALGSAPQDNNANFIITVGDKEYKVQSTGIDNNPELIEISKDIEDGQVFALRGEIYVKTRGKVIGVEGRTTSKKGYEELKNDIIG